MKENIAVKLLVEKIDLHEKMCKLREFLKNPANTREIESKELDLMHQQLVHIEGYYKILNSRAYYHANNKWP